MNKNNKLLKLPTKYKNNKTMGYLPLDFDDSYFKQFMGKYNSIHPYAKEIVKYAMFSWNRKADQVIENGVTKNFFEGDYSNIYFHKNLETIIRELKFTFSEGRTRNIVPVWLFLDMSQMTYSSMKETRFSNNETLSSDIISKNNQQASMLTDFSMEEMTFPRVNSVFPCQDLAVVSNRYFADNTLFNGTIEHQQRMLKLIPYNPYRPNEQKTLLPELHNFNEQNNFISMVFNNDAIFGKSVPSEVQALGPEFINPSRFIRDLITIHALFRKGTMSYTQPLYHNFPLAMWENIDLFNREVYAHSFKSGIGDQTQVKTNSYINEMLNDTTGSIVQNNTTVYGNGRKINPSPTLARGTLKPLNFLLTVLEQAKEMMKWIETDQFPVEFRSNFDASKTINNENFIQSQLQFMNSMGDAVQREIINDKVEWQQKKDEILLEIENKKKALSEAISAKRSLVTNLTNSKAVKDATIKNYVVELEKRYITQ